jgi:hypothetical protein
MGEEAAMNFFRRTVPVLIAFGAGLGMIVGYYIPQGSGPGLGSRSTSWTLIILALAFFLGLIGLVRLHWQRVRARQAGWGYSLLLLLALFGTLAASFLREIDGGIMLLFGAERSYLERGVQAVLGPEYGLWGDSAGDSPYLWIFDYLYAPLDSAMFSMLAFFIASAAFRSFRARNLSATLLLAAAVLVMFGRVPLGEWLLRTSLFSDLAEWIVAVPTTAARRAIYVGISLGAVATSLRIIFGIERPYMGTR